MKKTSSIVKIICLVLIIMLCITNNVCKAVDYGATMELKGSKTTAYVGDTVTYTLSLKSATNVEGVATVHAKINYDSSVLQYVSCEATNSWSAPVYNSENNEFVTERSDVMKPVGDIIKITFKVIAVPNEKTTTVSITNFDVADTENEITVIDVSANLKIEEKDIVIDKPNDDNKKDDNDINIPNDDNEKDNNNVEDNNTTVDDEQNNNIDNSQNTEKSDNTINNIQNKDNTIHNGNIPQTGMYTIIPFIAIVLIATSAIMYIKYKNMKDIN